MLPRLVLGAGLSGLSVALALVRAGVREDVVVIDRRTRWGRDRSWSFWDVGPTPFTHLSRTGWEEWEILEPSGRAHGRSTRHPYRHLDSRDVYAHALEELERAPQVTLRLGERVLAIEEEGDRVRVRTSAGELDGSVAIDALAAGSPALRGRRPGEVELAQSFLGLHVRTEQPVFTPRRATLMDFRVAQDGALHFVYVLPFAADEALVEDTWIAAAAPSPARRRGEVDAWLERAGAGAWEVRHEERGRIPMTSHPFAVRRGRRVHAAGEAGGAVRPSSGYAFVRTQAHAAALARALVRGEEPPARIGATRWAWLDRVFLRALVAEPEAFPGRFRRLLAQAGGDAFARFMSDASSPVDEARVIAALPKLPFARAALDGRGRVAQEKGLAVIT